ncbi:hypothetical protein JO40_09455 [Treponema putidum]|nr:hypothetical protein JO40_09455 [Treponema putidum]
MGTLINLSQTAHLISFSVKYAALCDMSVEKFKKITFAVLHIITKTKVINVFLSLAPLKIWLLLCL